MSKRSSALGCQTARWRNSAEPFEPTSGPTSQYTFVSETASLSNFHLNSDAHIDTWPRGTVHNYGLDAKRAIIQACNDHWEELFLFTNDAGDSYEELVESDLLLPDFYAT